MKIHNITPVPKPRMTRRDKWEKRPCVLRYFAFKDECRLKKVELSEDGNKIIFVMPMPKSWSLKKKRAMDGSPHQQKPDADNLLKAIYDAVFDDDAKVWRMYCEKRWGFTGKIVIDEL